MKTVSAAVTDIRNDSAPAGTGTEGGGGDRKSLDRALVHGIAWTAAVKWCGQLLSWVSTIVVARLLTPEDYGLVAMAGVFLGFIALINEFGLGAAVVALRHLTGEQIEKLHSLAAILGALGFGLACLASVPAGNFFRSSALPPIMVIAGVGFIFVALRSIPSALCEKELRFKFLAFLEGGQSIVTTVATVGLAWKGAGYWALVLGGVIGHVAATVALTVVRPLRYAWPSLRSMKEAVQLGAHVLVGRISWYVASSSDVFIGGRVLGQAIIGTYSFAATIANVPLEKVTALASRVMPAFYSSVQRDPAALRRYLLLLTEGISLITFPAGVGIALVSQDFVSLFLGEKWHGVVAPLQVLACWAALRSVVGLVMPILNATGNSRLGMFNGLFCAITYPFAFWVGSRFGVVGLALAWAAAQPPSWVTPYWRVFQVTRLSPWGYLSALWPALSAVIVMVVCIIGLQHIFPDNWSLLHRFMIEFAVGVVSYGMAVTVLHRERVLSLLKLLRTSRG